MKRKSSEGPKGSATGLFLRLAAWIILPALLLSIPLYLPDPDLEAKLRSPQGIVISDRNGETLYSVPGNEGAWMVLNKVPDRVKELFLHLEDKRFYRHGGIDPLAVWRAAALAFSRGRIIS